MHRTAAHRIVPILGMLLFVLAVAAPGARVEAAPPASTEPPITANDFFPEQRDVTDCIGVLERPGCGSESRGGWRQVLVFGLIAVGLVVVFTKITIEVRRNRSPGPDETSGD
ncbi:MAG: hypothetical protein QNM02_09720 [Acidimicrobiia bacterium]|nr:hypothetical protein [Acidimicrobiia bacterium]